jgi:hypothetical protein
MAGFLRMSTDAEGVGEGRKPRRPIRMNLRDNAYDFLNESIRSAERAHNNDFEG